MVRIYLTGRMTLEGESARVEEADLPGVQGRVALAALVLARRPVARDWLAGALWTDDELPTQWDKALSPIVSKLRVELDKVGLDGRATLVSSPGALEFRRSGQVTVDVEQCMNALDAAEGAARAGELDAAWSNAVVVTAIGRRSLLPGVGSDWVEEQRRLLSDAHVRALDVLVGVWLERGDSAQAIATAKQLVALDRLSEHGHRRLIEAYGADGDGASAARAFRECERQLAEGLGVTPSAATEAALAAAKGSPAA